MQTQQMVKINEKDVPVKEYQGKRVITLKEIDSCHERPDGTARRNFNQNKQHLIENVDYFVIELTSDEIRTQFGISKNAGRTVTLITESGYLMLVKSFTDDLAWKVQRELVNTYFRQENKLDVSQVQNVLLTPDFIIQLATVLKTEQEKNVALTETVTQQEEQIKELKPKGEYYDIVLATPNLMNITEIAKDYGISPKIFNIVLNQLEIVYKNNGRWVLYHALTQEGLAKSNTYTFVDYYGRPNSALNLQWTQKGRLYIYNRLKEVGILPMVENPNGNDDNETVKTAKRIAGNTSRYKRVAGDTMRQICEHLEKKTHPQKWFAQRLGISVSTLRSKIDKYKADPTQETY